MFIYSEDMRGVMNSGQQYALQMTAVSRSETAGTLEVWLFLNGKLQKKEKSFDIVTCVLTLGCILCIFVMINNLSETIAPTLNLLPIAVNRTFEYQ